MSNSGQKQTDVNLNTPARRANFASAFVTPSYSHNGASYTNVVAFGHGIVDNHSSVPAIKRSRSDQWTQDASIDTKFHSIDSNITAFSGVEDETCIDPLPIDGHKTNHSDQHFLQTALALFNVDPKGMYTKNPL